MAGGGLMGGKPNNVTRLEVELCKHGFHDRGYAWDPLDPTANDEGHFYYSEILTMSFNIHDKDRRVSFDFSDRYTEKAVEMSGYVHTDQLMDVCRAIVETHKRKSRPIQIKAIVTISTAVAVCEALRGAGKGDYDD